MAKKTKSIETPKVSASTLDLTQGLLAARRARQIRDAELEAQRQEAARQEEEERERMFNGPEVEVEEPEAEAEESEAEAEESEQIDEPAMDPPVDEPTPDTSPDPDITSDDI